MVLPQSQPTCSGPGSRRPDQKMMRYDGGCGMVRDTDKGNTMTASQDIAGSSPRRLSRLSAGVMAAALAASFTSPAFVAPASAQQPQPATPRPAAPRPATPAPAPAAPAQAPAAAGQAAAGPTIVQVKPEPSQTEWTKVCGKDPGNQREICYTTRDFVSDQGQPVMAVAVYDVKGDPSRIVRFLLPIGLLLQPGMRFGVDQAQPIAGRFQICFPNGCFAEATMNEAQLNAFKRGTTINVSVQNQAAREVTFQVPLAGFAKGFDGAPIDPAELQKQQEALQAEIQKREDELRRRLSGEGAPATPRP
jgi:invasion protein IalB